MTKQKDDEFDGFISPDGEMVSIKDADRMFSFFIKRNEDPDVVKGALWAFALECVERCYYGAAYDYFDKILSLADAPSEISLAVENYSSAHSHFAHARFLR